MNADDYLGARGGLGRGVVLAPVLGFCVALLTTYMPVAGMGAAAAIGGGLLLSRQPQWLLLGFMISLAIPIQKTLGGIPLNAADALVVVWAVLWLFMLQRTGAPSFASLRVPFLVWAVSPFVIAVFLAQLGSINPGSSIKQSLRIVEWFVLLPLLLMAFAPMPRFWRFCAIALICVSSFFAIDGIVEVLTHGQRITGLLGIPVPVPEGGENQIRHTYDISGRAGSAFGGAQGLAMYLVMMSSVAIAHLLHSRSTGLRVLSALGLLICIGGLIAAESRGGLLGALGSLLTISLLLRPGLWRVLWLLAIPSVVLAILALAFWPSWDGTIAGLVPGRPDAVLDRLIIWGVVRDVFFDNPLIGVGLGNFHDEFFARGVTLNVELGYQSLHAHNTYLELLADTGAIGLLSYLAFLFLVARQLQRRWRVARAGQGDVAGDVFTLAAAGTLTAYCMFAMVDMLLLQNMHFTLVLLLSLGLTAPNAPCVGVTRGVIPAREGA